MEKRLLAKIIELPKIGGGKGEEGFGPWGWLGGVKDVGEAAREFASIISKIIGIMTVVAGIWFFFILLIGAFGYLSAGGDSEKIKSATKRIGNGLTGLIVIVLAYAFISLIGRMLGLDILNPQDVIELLGP